MNTKSKITKKILMDSILPENIIDNIINELNNNEKRANNYDYLDNLKITFGKHKNKTFGFLSRNEPEYCLWLIKNNINPHKNITKDLQRYLSINGNSYRRLKYKNHYKKKYYY